ncbi:MAG: lipid-A-disaccharide synthase [Candidatus Krumholzibacteriota bacterium]|nr:lipid-A-disaccharide synthase [Candidatus Krumholzibacteriota bacterium]
MPPERRILVVAGEASGDQAAAASVRSLRALRPDWAIQAVGGRALAAAGADLLMSYEEVAVMGFTEVLARLPAIQARLRRLRRLLAGGGVDLFLPVDFPGFNLRLAETARRAGVPVLYFIAPQVWAWGEGRVATLRRVADRLAVILPFEREWFGERGVDARFVGHPIMEHERPLAPEAPPPRLALLPGSRAQEVARHLPLMLAAAARVAAVVPGLECELLESPALPPAFYDRFPTGATPPTARHREESAAFLARQGAALVASGTATLEVAAAGLPMAVVYRTGRLNFALARRLVRVPNIALANLVAGEPLVPELIQGEASPAALADAVAPLLRPGPERERQRRGLLALREALGGPGCGERVARLAIELLEGP